MNASSHLGKVTEEEAKKSFEELAVKAAVNVFKEACIRILVYDEVLPSHIRAAFKIDMTKVLRQAFNEAVKDFEND